MKSLDKIKFLAQISYCNCNVAEGGPVQREGVVLWQNTLSNMGLYLSREKKSVARNINFQKKIIVKHPIVHVQLYTR